MPQPSALDLAKTAYAAYGASTHYRTHDDRPMPDWDGLGDRVQQAWIAAAAAVAQAVIEQPAEKAVRSEQPAPPRPSIGRIVHYTLSQQDAEAINRRRRDFQAFRSNFSGPSDPGDAGADGHVAHVGNHAQEGDVYPAMIVRLFHPETTTVNLQVFLDGNDVFWATSRQLGDGPSFWAWPERV